MPADTGFLEKTQQIKDLAGEGKSPLEKIFRAVGLPQSLQEAQERLGSFRQETIEALRAKIVTEPEAKKALELLYEQGGELSVAEIYCAGLDEVIQAQHAQLLVRGKKGVRSHYEVDGKRVDEETARTEAAERVLIERRKKVIAERDKIDPGGKLSSAEFNRLTPKQKGILYAAEMIIQAGDSFIMSDKTGAAERFSRARERLVAERDKISGLDDSEAKRVLGEVRDYLPESDTASTLAATEVGDIFGKPTSAPERRRASCVARNIAVSAEVVIRQITGAEPEKQPLRDIALESAAELTIDTYECALGWVRAAVLRERKGDVTLARGIVSLEEEMKSQEVNSSLLRKPFEARGERLWLDTVFELDKSYGMATGSGGIVADYKVEPGKFPAPIGLTVGHVRNIVEILGPGNFSRRVNPDLSTITGPPEPLLKTALLREARVLFGIDTSGGALDDLVEGIGGFQDYFHYEQGRLRGGLVLDSEPVGVSDSWQPPDSLWRTDHIAKAAAHLGVTKAFGIEPSAFIGLAVAREKLLLAGVDLGRCVSAGRQSAEALINAACQKKRLSDAGRRELIGDLNTILPHLGRDGRFKLDSVRRLVQARPWAEMLTWDKFFQSEKDIGAYLGGEAGNSVKEVLVGVAYDRYFDQLVRYKLGKGENLPFNIDALIHDSGFLRYRILREMGWDPTKEWLDNIPLVLAGTKWERYERDIRSQVRTSDGKVQLLGFSEEMRTYILRQAGVDTDRPLPERGYKAWLSNVKDLIKNAKKLGYDEETLAILEGIVGDPLYNKEPRDPLLAFKWQLARKAYEKYLEDGLAILRKESGVTVDEIWKRLKIEEDGLISMSETAREDVGDWGGDILGVELQGRLSPTFVEKVGKPDVVINKSLRTVMDWIHHGDLMDIPGIAHTLSVLPGDFEKVLRFLFPTRISKLVALTANVAAFTIAAQASGSLLAGSPSFHALPVPHLEQLLPESISWLLIVPVFPGGGLTGIGKWIVGVLFNLNLGGVYLQSKFFEWGLEGINFLLKKARQEPILSQKGLVESRAPKKPK